MAIEPTQQDKVLMLASGLSGAQVTEYPYKENGWYVIAINHGWMHYPDEWDYWIHSTDFKGDGGTYPAGYESKPNTSQYSEVLRNFGGHTDCGFSITLASAYNALWYCKPKMIGFLGADMNYSPNENGDTHVYGVGIDIRKNGIPDPDRMVEEYGNGPDYLKNLYLRFAEVALKQQCWVYNFSADPNTRLPYKQTTPELL